MGEAVIERSADSVEIRLDFPFARFPGRGIARGEPALPSEVTAPRRCMSLRALMHYLFERAGFNRWVPAMAGKRNQGVLHKYLMEAAEEIQAKGMRLAQRLYVPEPFSEDRKAEIARRRREALAVLQAPEDDGQLKLGLVLGELKGCEASALWPQGVGEAHAGLPAVHRREGLGAYRAQLRSRCSKPAMRIPRPGCGSCCVR